MGQFRERPESTKCVGGEGPTWGDNVISLGGSTHLWRRLKHTSQKEGTESMAFNNMGEMARTERRESKRAGSPQVALRLNPQRGGRPTGLGNT